MAEPSNVLDIMPKWAWLLSALLMTGIGALALLAVQDLVVHSCFGNHAICANEHP